MYFRLSSLTKFSSSDSGFSSTKPWRWLRQPLLLGDQQSHKPQRQRPCSAPMDKPLLWVVFQKHISPTLPLVPIFEALEGGLQPKDHITRTHKAGFDARPPSEDVATHFPPWALEDRPIHLECQTFVQTLVSVRISATPMKNLWVTKSPFTALN